LGRVERNLRFISFHKADIDKDKNCNTVGFGDLLGESYAERYN